MKETFYLFITVSEVIPLPTLTLDFTQRKAQRTSSFSSYNVLVIIT